MNTLAIFGQLGGWEILLLLVLGLLIFGRRLPEVAKNLGKGVVEFKKGLSGIEDQIDHAADPHAGPPKQIDKPATSHDMSTSEQDPVETTAEHKESQT